MRKLVKRVTDAREAVAAFTGCVCGCGCNGNCTCPPYPTHAIGSGVRDQGKTQVEASNSGQKISNA